MSYLEWLTHLTALFGGVIIGIGISCWWFIREGRRLNKARPEVNWEPLDFGRKTDVAPKGFVLPKETKVGGPGSLL